MIYLFPCGNKRARLSQFTGTPILQVRNTFYDYWTNDRDLTKEEVCAYLGSNYLGNMREKV